MLLLTHIVLPQSLIPPVGENESAQFLQLCGMLPKMSTSFSPHLEYSGGQHSRVAGTGWQQRKGVGAQSKHKFGTQQNIAILLSVLWRASHKSRDPSPADPLPNQTMWTPVLHAPHLFSLMARSLCIPLDNEHEPL
jgi:hypothetical protein